MEQLAQCLACGTPSERAKVVYRRKDDALVRCPRCRLLYANPQYTPEELAPLYGVEYYEEQKNLASDFRERDFAATRALYQTVVRDLLRRYPSLARPRADGGARRVLDFGSGVGFFLVACRDHGLEPLGIDFSDVASRYARQRFQLEVQTDPDRAIRALPAERFDLITAWQVVEHLRRPRETLELMVRALAPGGVLCIGVPNLGCWRHRLERGRWFNITNPTHLAFFSRETLAHVLGELGLTGIHRPLFWGGRPELGRVGSLAQYLARLTNLGSDLRLYARKPEGAARG